MITLTLANRLAAATIRRMSQINPGRIRFLVRFQISFLNLDFQEANRMVQHGRPERTRQR
ncbi:hypothetical protein [Roseiconus lacunae]|uniref:Uncharacterized protein n=1 Tax=Roseiconus lacunae TaxID=2605694 RepID=A0ABT7PFT6_9BACT|nr:hypothetical protein [Roseiconus lacunae]MDM4015076.1 hypothetical protein [Roseiconus lacunae]